MMQRSVPATLVELWRWTWEAGSMARSARGEVNQLGLEQLGFSQLGLKHRVMMWGQRQGAAQGGSQRRPG